MGMCIPFKKVILEGIPMGHCEPITKEEIDELYKYEDSMCTIYSKKIINGKTENLKGTGFFLCISNELIPFNNCLMTNNHILNKNSIENNKDITIEYQNKKKVIKINGSRRAYTNEYLDYTCIEILDEDNIKKFFLIDENINDENSYQFKEIFILQYPGGYDKLSFSAGKIITIESNLIKHTCATKPGSSGSPMLSRFSNYNVVGLHFGAEIKKDKNKEFNLSIPIYSVIKDIIDKSNSIIIAEIDINEEDINEEIRIINSYEESVREYKWEFDKNEYKNEYKNEMEIKENCKIEINGKIIPFCYYYKFQTKGKYIIKYLFSKKLTKTNHMYFFCKSLNNIDLSNFNTENVTNMSCMFRYCEFLKNINLYNFNTQNVTDMSCMFAFCESLKNIDLSNFNTENVTDMSRMFWNCKTLRNIDLSNFNTQNVTNMSEMFSLCTSLKTVDLSKFNTQKVVDISHMFSFCESLKSIDLSSFNSQTVMDIRGIFEQCNSLKKENIKVTNKEILKEVNIHFH